MQIKRRKDKLSCLYCRNAALDDEIAQIESHAQACLSMTEMQAMTQSANNGGIDAFGIRFSAPQVMIANELATCDVFYPQVVAVSRVPSSPLRGRPRVRLFES